MRASIDAALLDRDPGFVNAGAYGFDPRLDV
jgi:hypothetical protein